AIFDFELICAGVLRMVSDGKKLDRFQKAIDPDYFFYGDKTLRIRALRKIMVIIQKFVSDKGASNLTIETVSALVGSAGPSEENDEAKSLWPWILNDESVRKKASDDGCFLIFMDYLKVTHLLKWSKPFQSEY